MNTGRGGRVRGNREREKETELSKKPGGGARGVPCGWRLRSGGKGVLKEEEQNPAKAFCWGVTVFEGDRTEKKAAKKDVFPLK